MRFNKGLGVGVAVLAVAITSACSPSQPSSEQETAQTLAAFGVDGTTGRYVVTSQYRANDRLYWEQGGKRTEVTLPDTGCEGPALVLIPVDTAHAGLLARCAGGTATATDLSRSSTGDAFATRLPQTAMSEAAWRAAEPVTYALGGAGGTRCTDALLRYRAGAVHPDALIRQGEGTAWRPTDGTCAAGTVSGVRVAVSDDGRSVAVASSDGAILMVDEGSGATRWVSDGFPTVGGLTFAGAQRLVATATT